MDSAYHVCGASSIGLVPLDTLRGYPELKYLPMTQVKKWTDLYEQRIYPTLPDKPVREQAIANRRRLLKAFSHNGVGILFGTDSPQLFNVPGFSIHREIELMAGAGMTPYDILQSATKNVGEYFKATDKFGTIAVGNRADLILLEKNPLKDVANIANPLGVMVGGRWLSQKDIREKLTAISQQLSGKASN